MGTKRSMGGRPHKKHPSGFPPLPESDDEVFSAFIRLARRLRHQPQRAIGLLPAAPEVGVPPVAMYLASALTHLGSAPVSVIDANTALPGIIFSPTDVDQPAQGLHTTRVTEGIALTATSCPDMGGTLQTLIAQTIEDHRRSYEFVLVDLTGLERLGQLEETIAVVEAVLTIVDAGETAAGELERRQAAVPRDKALGVLMAGR